MKLSILVALTAFVLLLCSTAGPFRAVTGQGVSAKEANARLWNCLVPDDATDVWYLSSYSNTQVECRIEPESFRLWSERMGWQLQPILEGEPATKWQMKGDRVSIESGLWFDERVKPTLGFFGVYDSRNKRAYVNFTLR
jgi:hypothetical protein